MFPYPSIFDRIRLWWRMRQAKRCDSCNGTFVWGDLSPTSGDWWLCADCIEKTFRESSHASHPIHS